MVVDALQNKSTEFDSLNSDSSCPEIATAIENSNISGLGELVWSFQSDTTTWTSSSMYTAPYDGALYLVVFCHFAITNGSSSVVYVTFLE